MTKLTEGAFAKINLTLDVLGRREDGYHDLSSVMQTISVRDDVEIILDGGGEWKLFCDREDIPQDEVPKEDGQEVPPDVTFDPDGDTPKRVKYYVNDVPVSIINERVQYLDADGKLITESLVDYTRKNIRKEYATLDEFLQRWNSAQKKTAIVEELEQKGIFFEELREEISKDLDPFDLICHIAFDMPPLTRKERANNVKKRGYFGKYNEVAKQVLEALLDKYADEGLANLESMEVLKVPDVARFGTPVEILKCFGNKKKFMEAIAELENQLYVA